MIRGGTCSRGGEHESISDSPVTTAQVGANTLSMFQCSKCMRLFSARGAA